MRISDWSSDVCSSDLSWRRAGARGSSLRGARLPYRSGCGHDHAACATISRCLLEVEPHALKIGRASCRERVCQYVYISAVAVSFKKKTQNNKHYYTKRNITQHIAHSNHPINLI